MPTCVVAWDLLSKTYGLGNVFTTFNLHGFGKVFTTFNLHGLVNEFTKFNLNGLGNEFTTFNLPGFGKVFTTFNLHGLSNEFTFNLHGNGLTGKNVCIHLYATQKQPMQAPQTTECTR